MGITVRVRETKKRQRQPKTSNFVLCKSCLEYNIFPIMKRTETET